MIKIEDVSFRYKNSENVLENINLEINEGEFISIVGKMALENLLFLICLQVLLNRLKEKFL